MIALWRIANGGGYGAVMIIEALVIEAVVCSVVPFTLGFAAYMLFGFHDVIAVRLRR